MNEGVQRSRKLAKSYVLYRIGFSWNPSSTLLLLVLSVSAFESDPFAISIFSTIEEREGGSGGGGKMAVVEVKTTMSIVLVFFQMVWLMGMAVSSTAYSSAYPSDADQACDMEGGELKVVRREEYDGGRILDISHVYSEDMPVWESSDGLGHFLWLAKSMKNGSLTNNSEMKLPTHTGTHVDAPGHVIQHYFEAGFDVDTLDLAVLNGPALLVDVPRDKNITAAVMKSLSIPKGVRRVLFRTLNTDRKLMWKRECDTSYVGFMKDGAQWLVENTDIKLVGVDYLSVAAYDDLIPSHLVFLESREIILVEALKLDDVKPGIYSLHCLPLRLRGAEGSPIRCILIK